MPTKPKTKAKPQLKSTNVIFLLDRSGSMANVRDETISGVNHYLAELRKDTKRYGKVKLTVVQFDSESIDTLHKDADPAKVPDWTKDTFVPRSMTPLVDAMAKTISNADAKTPHLFVTVTDGQENASHEWTSAKLKALVEERIKAGWTFVYLGADHDAFAQASAMGMSAANTMQYDKSNTGQVFGTVSAGTRLYRAGGAAPMGNFSAQVAAAQGETEAELRAKLNKKKGA